MKRGRNLPKRELKFFDTDLAFNFSAAVAIPATGQLCIIPQDDTQSGRDGNMAIIKSIHIKGVQRLVPGGGAGAGLSAESTYIWLVEDLQANGAAATAASATVGVFTNANPQQALPTLANSDRFKILAQRKTDLVSNTGVVTGWSEESKIMKDIYMKCNIPIKYDSSVATGAIGSIRSNNLFLVVAATTTADIVSFEGVCRLRFSD